MGDGCCKWRPNIEQPIRVSVSTRQIITLSMAGEAAFYRASRSSGPVGIITDPSVVIVTSVFYELLYAQ